MERIFYFCLMQLFYTPNIRPQATAILSEEESSHLFVLRKKEGDIIHVTDGNGYLYEAVLLSITRKQAAIICQKILSETALKNSGFHLAIAPTKNMDRIEWLVEKATEIGMDSISFVRCKNSERREMKLDRLQKIMQNAAKQSFTFRFPIIHPLTDFEKFIQQPFDGKKMIAYCEEKTAYITAAIANDTQNMVLIGPEGDFTESEVALAKANGFSSVSLGEKRLRVETAGIYALTAFHILQNNT